MGRFLEYFALGGLGGCLLALVGVYFWRLSRRLRSFARAYGVLGLLILGLSLFATLTEGPPDEDYKDAVEEELEGEDETNAVYGAMMLMAPRHAPSAPPLPPPTISYAMPTNALSYEPWTLRGAAEDWFKLDFGDWRFPMGTNEHSAFRVFTDGTIRPKLHSTNDTIIAVGAAMSAIPGVSRFWYAVGTNDSRILTWENFALGRIANSTFDLNLQPQPLSCAQIQLFRSGDYIVRSNDVERLYRFADPFDVPEEEWGQSDADKEYIDSVVGTNLENGYYKLTVTVPPSVGRRTLITVGNQWLVADRPGDYAFLLEKGVRYDLDLNPYNPDITFDAVDDIRPPMMLLAGTAESPLGVWTKDFGWHEIVSPTKHLPGWCYWIPKFSGTPDVSFVDMDDSFYFGAELSDCPYIDGVTYEWTSEDENLCIWNPRSQWTRVDFYETPRWASTCLKVTATLGTNTLESVLRFNYGCEEYPEPICGMSAPEVVFVNDDQRTSRYYRVELTLDAPLSANASVELTCQGVTASFFSDEKGLHPLSDGELLLSTGADNPVASRVVYMSCPITGDGTLGAAFTIEGEGTELVSRDFVVIEPLRKLVCTEPTSEGGYYNPSRLVAGSNAWLKVGVNGDFSAEDVNWRVVSGPGRIAESDGFTAKVVPTATSGEVVVEAAFGHDSMIQPRFVLPIVEMRRVPVIAFVVCDDDGSPAISQADVDAMIEYANQVYTQVGVFFYLLGDLIKVEDPSFYVLSEHDMQTNVAGRAINPLGVSAQAKELYSRYPSNDCIRLFWVGSITNGTTLAFTSLLSKCCVFSKISQSDPRNFAHELGHTLGLSDIYVKSRDSTRTPLPNGLFPLKRQHFGDKTHDWGADSGRAFYELSDVRTDYVKKLLMYGYSEGSVDIPYGRVSGYTIMTNSTVYFVKVGASNIKEE